ncbi:helix-turn-helix domain-containing protein [Bradyrhizobium sp. I1.14.4]|uniref:helix-turn-helix domain-containing protein n=1 Tax=unclassified Bradyrhizobium TaxID=2631580 RepID=UPI003D2464F7
MKKSQVSSISAINGLKKLGADIRAARKRRRMTQQRLADGAGVALPTLRRLELGDPGVSLATLAMALVVLGEGKRLSNLLDTGTDDLGLMLETQKLPQRVRVPRKTAKLDRAGATKSDLGPIAASNDDDFGEAF